MAQNRKKCKTPECVNYNTCFENYCQALSETFEGFCPFYKTAEEAKLQRRQLIKNGHPVTVWEGN